MAVWVELSLPEMINGAIVGCMRHFESVSANRKDRHGFDSTNSGLSIHIEGACGEIAVAKSRGRYFGGTLNSFKAADLGADVQVKTRSKHDYELIVRSNDNPDHIFVLVTGVAPRYCVRGWLYGREAMQDRFRASHGGREEAFFVPHASLRPFVQAQASKAA